MNTQKRLEKTNVNQNTNKQKTAIMKQQEQRYLINNNEQHRKHKKKTVIGKQHANINKQQHRNKATLKHIWPNP